MKTSIATPNKSAEESFKDWESYVFGFGYGSGEDHVLAALKTFFENIPLEGGYDYKILEEALTPPVAWLLINRLCQVNIIEYGTSPRYGWLKPRGKRLRDFICRRSVDDLSEMVCDFSEDYHSCSPDACCCDQNGYGSKRECPNPFWCDDVEFITVESVPAT